MSRVKFPSAPFAGLPSRRPALIVKMVLALAACLTLRVVLAQAPAPTAAEVVDARGFKVLVPHENLAANTEKAKKALRETVTQINQILNRPDVLGDRRTIFENYYSLYLFPILTQTTDEALKALPDERQRLFRDLERCKSLDAHAVLVGLTLQEMNKIVNDNFHPAVRYSAMLTISGLNDVEPQRTLAPYMTPEPMTRALPVIFANYQKAKDNDPVKVAALLGLVRHLEWDSYRTQNLPASQMTPGQRKAVVDELLKLAQMKTPPANVDPQGHVWLRRRAVEGLGNACAARQDPGKPDAAIAQVPAALDALLRDETEPLPLRLTVAATLGRMSFPAAANIDPKATAVELGYLALVACDTELNRVANIKKVEEERAIRLAGGLPGGEAGAQAGFAGLRGPGGSADGGAGVRPGGFRPPPGGIGGESGGSFDPLAMDPKAYRFDYTRKRLRHNLYCVQVGLLGGEDHKPGVAPPPPGKTAPGGAAGAAAPTYGMWHTAKVDADKQFIDNIYYKVRSLVNIVENQSVDLVQLDRDLRREMKNLEAVTRKIAPPPAPMEDLDDDLLAAPKPAPGGTVPMPMPPATPMPPVAVPPGKAGP